MPIVKITFDQICNVRATQLLALAVNYKGTYITPAK